MSNIKIADLKPQAETRELTKAELTNVKGGFGFVIRIPGFSFTGGFGGR
jgi:uncharacterized membrane protein